MTFARQGLKLRLLAATTLVTLAGSRAAYADGPSFEIYGHAQLDYIQDFNRVDPNWEDTLRPSRIPTTDGQFGTDGQSSVSVKQSKFGVQATQDIAGQPLLVKFDFDLFGVGDNEGQTTFRLQNFYGSWGPILAGQTDTNFMDGSIFPNTIDYWGPAGMVYVRTPQIRYTYKSNAHEFTVAIEKPNNDIDPGNIRLVDPELGSNIVGDEKVPDLTAHYRYTGDWGHVQLAGILRQVAFETQNTPDNAPHGHKTGWGFNLTSNIKTWNKDTLHLGVVYGEGIASYMNDGGTDLGPKLNHNPTVSPPIVGAPVPAGTISPDVLPLLGLMIYYDHFWNDKWSTSLGWSQTKVNNTSFQEPVAFQTGQYASINLLYTPEKHLLMGAELLYGSREDKNGNNGDDTRIQVSFKYTFNSSDFK